MKLRKVVAGLAAAAVAASSIVVSAFAAGTPTNATEAGKFACLISNDSTVAMCATKDDAVKVTGVHVILECKDKDFEASVAGGTDYYGGTLLFFSDSVAWNASNQHDWSIQDGVKELTLKPTDKRYQYEVGFNKGSTVFSASDTYAYAAFQDYTGTADMTIVRYELLDKDGNILYELDTDGSAPILSTPGKAVDATAPAEPTTPDEPTAEPAEPTAEPAEPTAEPAEPTAEPEETAEPTVESEEPTAEPEETGEPVEAEADWDLYDAEAAAAANEAFKFGETDAIDLYSVLGDDIYDLAKVDATFTWTAGTGWCGGAGIANAISEDGSTWLSGPEFGCANANEALVNDGTATQTIVDITGNPLTTIATVDAEGNSTFATLLVQNWWNGVEAGAQLTKLSFTDADGNVLGELTWGEDATDAPSTPATTPSDSKGSPDTGVAGVAAAAGVAALAGVAVVVARKRK